MRRRPAIAQRRRTTTWVDARRGSRARLRRQRPPRPTAAARLADTPRGRREKLLPFSGMAVRELWRRCSWGAIPREMYDGFDVKRLGEQVQQMHLLDGVARL